MLSMLSPFANDIKSQYTNNHALKSASQIMGQCYYSLHEHRYDTLLSLFRLNSYSTTIKDVLIRAMFVWLLVIPRTEQHILAS